MGEIHGTATKKNNTGKAKWRNHVRPPPDQIANKVNDAEIARCSQPSGRQSGFAISKSRSGKSGRSARTPMTIQSRVLCTESDREGVGRLSHRNQKRNAPKKGT